MTNGNDSVLSCSRISKSYQQGRNIITVLENVDLNIKAAERVAIVGTSGSMYDYAVKFAWRAGFAHIW